MEFAINSILRNVEKREDVGDVSAAIHWCNVDAVDHTLEVLTSSCSIHELPLTLGSVQVVEGVFTLLSFSQTIPVKAVKFAFAVDTFVSGK